MTEKPRKQIHLSTLIGTMLFTGALLPVFMNLIRRFNLVPGPNVWPVVAYLAIVLIIIFAGLLETYVRYREEGKKK